MSIYKIITNGTYDDGSIGYGIINTQTGDLIHGADPISYDEAETELEYAENNLK